MAVQIVVPAATLAGSHIEVCIMRMWSLAGKKWKDAGAGIVRCIKLGQITIARFIYNEGQRYFLCDFLPVHTSWAVS
jgi:hypothetical protein